MRTLSYHGARAVKAGGDDLIVFGGADGAMIIEEIQRGSVGTMPTYAFPELFRKVWDLFVDGKEAEPMLGQFRFAPLTKTLS